MNRVTMVSIKTRLKMAVSLGIVLCSEALVAGPSIATATFYEGLRAATQQQAGSNSVVYYDFLQGGQLKGGAVVADPSNRLLSASTSLPPPNLPPYASTTVVNHGPSSRRIDVVLVGDGYTNSELTQYGTDASAIATNFFASEVLHEYYRYFNVHRVDVISNQSGVDHDPNLGMSRDTALDMGFWCGGIDRLLCVDVAKARAAATNAPGADQILAIANSTTYGGAGYPGDDVGTLSGRNGSALEVALHEFGHSFADLADEYDYGGSSTYNGPELAAANVSIYPFADMQTSQTKWHRWLGDFGVSTFEGANYSQFGVYRPTGGSKMRVLGAPFESVNNEQFVLKIYQIVSPIDDATPGGTYAKGVNLSVTPMQPQTHSLSVQWWLDGQPISGATGHTLDTGALAMGAGSHTVSVRVIDPTDVVRDPSIRQQWLTAERSWTITQGGSYNKTYDQVYFRGTPNGWAVTAMNLVANNTWELVANFGAATNERFKFDIYANWSLNFGDNNRDGVAEQSGSDILISQGAGSYRITFNDSTRGYTVQKLVVNQPPLANAGPDQVVNVGQTVQFDGTGSRDVDGSIVSYLWNNGMTGSRPTKIYNAAGTYAVQLMVTDNQGASATDDVVITVQNADAYQKTYPNIYLRGTHNSWGATAMSLVGNYTWSSTVTFGEAAGERFKFDVHADWSLNFGDDNNDRVAEQGGSDIALTQGAGSYTITFNDQTKAYTVVSSGGLSKTYNQVYLRGTHNNWATNVQMTLVESYVWQAEVDFGAASNERFKFDIHGNWALNFGDTNRDGTAEQSGSDILITQGSGTYRIRFNDQTKQYTVTKMGGYSKVYNQLYLRGTFNQWSSLPMQLVSNNTWQSSVVTFGATATERFKFDVQGDWSLNFGDSNRDGFAEQSGADIPVNAGTRVVIQFNDSTRRYILLPQ
jgi:hypothetical protein